MPDALALDQLRVLLVSTSDSVRDAVTAILANAPGEPRFFWISQPDLATVRARDLAPQAILVDDELGGADLADLAGQLAATLPGVAVVALVPEQAIDRARTAMLAGARAFITKPLQSDDLLSALRQVSTRRPVSPEAPPSELALGRVVVFCGSKGGTGRTTLAVNTSISLCQASGKPVVLVDADYAAPAIDVALNLRGERCLSDLLPKIAQLDRPLIDSVLAQHSSGLRALLAPPPETAFPSFTVPQLQQLLLWLRRMFAWVVIDLGLPIDDLAFGYLDAADWVLMSAMPEMIGLRNARLMIRELLARGYPEDKVALVINRADMAGGLQIADVEGHLGLKVSYQIPNDQALATDTINRGVPLVLTHRRSVLARAYQELARRLIEAPVPARPAQAPPAPLVAATPLARQVPAAPDLVLAGSAAEPGADLEVRAGSLAAELGEAPAEVPVEEPVAEAPVEGSLAEVPLEEPLAEAPAQQPLAEVPVEEPLVAMLAAPVEGAVGAPVDVTAEAAAEVSVEGPLAEVPVEESLAALVAAPEEGAGGAPLDLMAEAAVEAPVEAPLPNPAGSEVGPQPSAVAAAAEDGSQPPVSALLPGPALSTVPGAASPETTSEVLAAPAQRAAAEPPVAETEVAPPPVFALAGDLPGPPGETPKPGAGPIPRTPVPRLPTRPPRSSAPPLVPAPIPPPPGRPKAAPVGAPSAGQPVAADTSSASGAAVSAQKGAGKPAGRAAVKDWIGIVLAAAAILVSVFFFGMAVTRLRSSQQQGARAAQSAAVPPAPPAAVPPAPPASAAGPAAAPSPARVAALALASSSTPSPSPTASVPPTPTATATATSSATASPVPSQTPAPTDTDTPVPTETVTATHTPAPSPTATRRRPTPTATREPSATPTPTVLPLAPNPVAPAANAAVRNLVQFQWQPAGTLPPGASYEVVWWNRGENPVNARGMAAPTAATSLSVDLRVIYDSGKLQGTEVYWTVLVVHTLPYERLTQPAADTARLMIIPAPAGVLEGRSAG